MITSPSKVPYCFSRIFTEKMNDSLPLKSSLLLKKHCNLPQPFLYIYQAIEVRNLKER